ncbi:hypothetical protein PG988_004855 [Apiospora saccharicola]
MGLGQAPCSDMQGQEAAEDTLQAGSIAPKEHRCSECNYDAIHIWDLGAHAKKERHATFHCKTPGCATSFAVKSHLEAHEAHPHVPGHFQVESNGLYTCAECGEAFDSRNQQQLHGENSQHSPFVCACGVTFSRVDVLHRHIDGYAKDVPKFPCKFCKFHRGKHGFRRRDHLVQHLRGYHKFDEEDISEACPPKVKLGKRQFPTCPHRGCDFFRDDAFQSMSWHEQMAQRPFATQGTFTKHLKEVHKQTPFPCDVESCDRVGAKGYVREKDLMKHYAAKHPEVPGYTPKTRQAVRPCGIEGCDKTFSSNTMRFNHIFCVHWTKEERNAYWMEQE